MIYETVFSGQHHNSSKACHDMSNQLPFTSYGTPSSGNYPPNATLISSDQKKYQQYVARQITLDAHPTDGLRSTFQPPYHMTSPSQQLQDWNIQTQQCQINQLPRQSAQQSLYQSTGLTGHQAPPAHTQALSTQASNYQYPFGPLQTLPPEMSPQRITGSNQLEYQSHWTGSQSNMTSQGTHASLSYQPDTSHTSLNHLPTTGGVQTRPSLPLISNLSGSPSSSSSLQISETHKQPTVQNNSSQLQKVMRECIKAVISEGRAELAKGEANIKQAAQTLTDSTQALSQALADVTVAMTTAKESLDTTTAACKKTLEDTQKKDTERFDQQKKQFEALSESLNKATKSFWTEKTALDAAMAAEKQRLETTMATFQKALSDTQEKHTEIFDQQTKKLEAISNSLNQSAENFRTEKSTLLKTMEEVKGEIAKLQIKSIEISDLSSSKIEGIRISNQEASDIIDQKADTLKKELESRLKAEQAKHLQEIKSHTEAIHAIVRAAQIPKVTSSTQTDAAIGLLIEPSGYSEPDEMPPPKTPSLESIPDEMPPPKTPSLESIPDEMPPPKTPDLDSILPDEPKCKKARTSLDSSTFSPGVSGSETKESKESTTTDLQPSNINKATPELVRLTTSAEICLHITSLKRLPAPKVMEVVAALISEAQSNKIISPLSYKPKRNRSILNYEQQRKTNKNLTAYAQKQAISSFSSLKKSVETYVEKNEPKGECPKSTREVLVKANKILNKFSTEDRFLSLRSQGERVNLDEYLKNVRSHAQALGLKGSKPSS